MANPTSAFGWQMPTSTDLVTDLPADFETFGQAVDTSLADLKGGTTGQVLSKASNTDMDFTWVAQDDSNAIQNTIVDAKGDLIAATAADTPARLAVGANNTVLIADSAEATGLKWGGGFSTWTPSYANFTPGNGTLNFARYNKVGKLVHAEFCFTLGSTSAVTGSIIVSLPTSPKNTVPGSVSAGTSAFLDSGTAIYVGFPILSGVNVEVMAIHTGSTSAVYSPTTSTNPFTWTTGDAFSFNYTYEEA